MAKFEEVFEDTQALFSDLIAKADLEGMVNFKILADNKLKKVVGKVVKANDLVKHMTSEDVIVILNEKIFEQLTDEQKVMAAEDILACVSFDSEKDIVVINKPDVNTYSLLLRKHTYAKYEVLLESIKTLFQVEKDRADEAKENKPKQFS